MAQRTLQEILSLIGRGLLEEMPARDAGKAITDIRRAVEPAKRLPKAGETMVVRSLPKGDQPTKDMLDPMGYGETKLARPIEAYTPTVEKTNVPLNPKRMTTLEEMQGGYVLPLYGDRSAAGGILTKVGDIELQRGYNMDGGFDFMRGPSNQANDAVWASGPGVMKPIISRAEELAKYLRREKGETDPRIYGATVSMIPDALDFNKFTPRVAVDLMQQFMTRKNAKLFDDELRQRKDMKDWPGILSPNADDWMLKASSDQQKTVLRFADTAKAKNYFGAVPDASAAARYATTSADARNMPAGVAGTAFARLDTSGRGILDNPDVPHSTYPVQARGFNPGNLIMPLDETELFRDAFNHYFSPNYVSGKGDVGALQRANATYANKTQLLGQYVDQQMVDGYMKRLERARSLGLLD